MKDQFRSRQRRARPRDARRCGARREIVLRCVAWTAGIGCLAAVAGGFQDAGESGQGTSPATLEETRLIMGKWIETQQIISKERGEWQQGKEILASRIDLLNKEVAELDGKIAESQASLAEAEAKRAEQKAAIAELTSVNDRLAEAAGAMETEISRLLPSVPDPLLTKLEPLILRMPADPRDRTVSVPERFQNILVILGELTKSNNELSVHYEVRTLADGKPSEVRAIYVGLAQAFYVSQGGEAGIGLPGAPGAEGWTWEPSKGIAKELLLALEILEGKHTPDFVPLPVKLQ
jgi:hypothetical protein